MIDECNPVLEVGDDGRLVRLIDAFDLDHLWVESQVYDRLQTAGIFAAAELSTTTLRFTQPDRPSWVEVYCPEGPLTVPGVDAPVGHHDATSVSALVDDEGVQTGWVLDDASWHLVTDPVGDLLIDVHVDVCLDDLVTAVRRARPRQPRGACGSAS